MPNHPKANKNGCVYEHILVAEQKLGRPLKNDECVHHIDENKRNNDPNNLIVFNSKADHTSFHHGGKLIQLDNNIYATEKKNIKISNKYKVNICPICGKEYKDISAKMCKKCYNIKLRDLSIMKSKDQLINDLIENASNLSKISRKYNVSDTTVKKWCKRYNIKKCLEKIK